MRFLTNFVRAATSLLTVICLLIVNIGEGRQKPDYYPDVGVTQFGGVDALLRGQGMTTDGKSLYFSANLCLTKTDMSGKRIIASNLVAIPKAIRDLGCDHIGGISYANGRIYATIEDSKVFENLYLAVYDSESLIITDCIKISSELHEGGVPWVVADPDNGVLYTARCNDIEQIFVYDARTLEYIKAIDINTPINKIQGGEMHGGILYLSVSRGDQAIYGVSLATGEVKKIFARNLIDGAEGEGMTIVEKDGKTYFYVLNIASIRAAVQMRIYDFVPMN